MYLKKRYIVIISIALILVTAVATVAAVNPFGIRNIGKFIKLSLVSSVIEDEYYQDVDMSEAAEMSILGLTAGANDLYTTYIWGEDMLRYIEELEGEFFGIGVYIQADYEENAATIVSVFEESPALKAGLKSGDKILKVDGVLYTAIQLNELSSAIKGIENTEVTLTIKDGISGEIRDITVKREKIETPVIESKMLDNNIGYVKISQFVEGLTEDFKEHIASFENMQSLIIDLRDNPGGIFEEAIGISSLFVPEDEIVTYTLNKQGERENYFAEDEEKITVPVVILLNEGSASASEVVSGALKDYNLAVIIGEESYGKGVVQSVYPIGFDSVLSVTTATYYTPSGKCIHDTGIKPDILVESSDDNDNQLNEAINYLLK